VDTSRGAIANNREDVIEIRRAKGKASYPGREKRAGKRKM
jgi:hypothetical protein